MKILFSPVGGTDPISNSNWKDGSMLHICRVYRPDKVILYLSREMIEKQERDDRYRYCLDRLAENTGWNFKLQEIERPDLENVHEFDYFYTEFKEILETVVKDFHEEDTLLLNISSGTPAMKSGLAVLQTIENYPCKLIQVTTPDRKMNDPDHTGYDVKALWEVDEDNKPGFENRCREITCPTLAYITQEGIIKKHIEAYDYSAALEVASLLPAERTKEYLPLLQVAKARELMNIVQVRSRIKSMEFAILPITDDAYCKYMEYALNMSLKLKRKEYADFIRAISPLLVDIFEMLLYKQAGIKINDYCSINKKDRGMIREWDRQKLDGTDVLKKLQGKYGLDFRYGFITADSLLVLIDAFVRNEKVVSICHDLRAVEENLRNVAAHEIVSISDETIRKKTGFTGEEIMQRIQKLFSYAGIPVPKGGWDSYETMNQMIIERM